MTLGHRLLLGRQRTPRAAWRSETRLCPVCGERRLTTEFIASKKQKGLNLFCNGCRQNNPEGVRRFLRAGRPVQKVDRREVTRFLRELARRRIAKRRGIKMTAEMYAVKLAKLPDRIAAIVGKTYAELGDAWDADKHLCDDTAMMMIRDLVNDLDESLIPRNKNKRLIRR